MSRSTPSVVSRRTVLALGFGAVAAVAVACGSEDQKSGGASSGGVATKATIILGSTAITSSIDPHLATSNVGRTYAINVFDTLVEFDGDRKIVPSLATAWKRIDDTTVELTLREGVTFHSGATFDAAAVKANLERILSGGADYALLVGRLGTVKGAEVISPTTVRISTTAPDPILLNRLATIDIVDPAMIGKPVTVENISGTGSFKVVGYSEGKEVKLERFDAAWQPSASIATATITAISDPSALSIAIKAGEVDTAFGLAPDQASQLAGSLNLDDPTAGSCAICSLIPDVEPLLGDPRVRQALNMAINHEEFVKVGLGGYGTVSTGQLLQPGYLGYNDSLTGFDYDPEKAKALLADAGATEMTLKIATTAFFKAQAEIVAGYLSAVGVKTTLELIDLAAFLPALLSKSDYALLYWQTDYFDLQDILAVTRFGPQAPGVQLHVENPEYVALYKKAAVELDETKRAGIIAEMAKVLHDDAGVLFLGWPNLAYVYGKDVDINLAGRSLIELNKATSKA